jgi:hypothetical protein
MRVVILITPGAPRRAKQKGRARPKGMAAADRVQKEKDVIAARGPRPVEDAHAAFRPADGESESFRVAERRGHGKPHAASTCFGATDAARRRFCKHCTGRPVIRVT